MKQIFKLLVLSITILSMTSCATGYKSIEPKTVRYNSTSKDKDVVLDYQYNVLTKKYYKKENRKGIKVASLKITNNSDKDLVFGKDLKLVNRDENELILLDNTFVYKQLKQSVPTYLLYLLLTPLKLFTSSGDTNSRGEVEQNSIPIGLVLGPGITGINMITAGNANDKFKKELNNYNLQGKTIKKGTTAYGIIGIQGNSFQSLAVKVVE